MARAFLIYADADRAAAFQLQKGLECNGIELVSSYSALRKCRVENLDDILLLTHFVILLCSNHWLACERCQTEFATVRSRGLSTLAMPVGDFRDENGVLDGIRTIDLRANDFGQQMAGNPDNAAPPWSNGAWSADRLPYPGLCAYTKEWSPVFFGRDREIQKIVDHIKILSSEKRSAVVALVGPAGSGLSSLMQAGVLPRLDDDAIVTPVLRLGAKPIRALARALSAVFGQEADFEAWARMLGDASQDSLTKFLGQCARELLKQQERSGATIVIPIDQIGDLLYAAEPAEVEAFERFVAAALSAAACFTFVLPMRFEDLELLQRREVVWAGIETISISPIDDAAIEEIIRKPLQTARYDIDETLVTALLFDAKEFDRAGLPARLSFVLRRLCGACAEDRILNLSVYTIRTHQVTRGNPLDEMIADSAEAAFDHAAPDAKESAAWRQALAEALVVLDQHKVPIRRLTSLNDIPVEAHRLVRELIAAGFMLRCAGPDGRFVEIASQVLFKVWPRLRTCVEAISREPVLIVSHREVTAGPEIIAGTDAARSDGAPVSTRQSTLRMTGLRAAAAVLAFVAGFGAALALLPKMGSPSAIGETPSQKLARGPMAGLAAMGVQAGPANMVMTAYERANTRVEKGHLALRLTTRRKLIRERLNRVRAEARARQAGADLEQTRGSIARAQQEFRKANGDLEDQLKSARAVAETNAAKIAELTARVAMQEREKTVALDAADTARQSLAEEQKARKSAEAVASESGEKAANDLENRLKAAEAVATQASQALASQRAANEASQMAARDIEHRLRQELSQERSLRLTADNRVAELENGARSQATAPSELKKLQAEQARERDPRTAAEAIENGGGNVENAAAADVEKLRSELERERVLREAAVKSMTEFVDRLAGKEAQKISSYAKAKLVIARERRRRERAVNAALSAQMQAEHDQSLKTSGWKAVSPKKSKAFLRSSSSLW